MYDAVSGWARLLASGYSMVETAARAFETMDASRQVISRRTALVGTALRSPLMGDHAELGRMVPEKVEAFSRAGSVTVAGWRSMHTTWLTHMQHLSAMLMRDRGPTLAELVDLHDRTAQLALELVEAGARLGSDSLAPVHHKAMANARRLRRMDISTG